MSLDIVDLDALLAQPESEHLEFKKATNTFHLDDVYSYTVALANELGGKLILGVDDTVPRKVVGTKAFVGEIEKLKQQILQIRREEVL
ncbi:MAG: ATP-binding protein [Spirochaetales bacterium]